MTVALSFAQPLGPTPLVSAHRAGVHTETLIPDLNLTGDLRPKASHWKPFSLVTYFSVGPACVLDAHLILGIRTSTPQLIKTAFANCRSALKVLHFFVR